MCLRASIMRWFLGKLPCLRIKINITPEPFGKFVGIESRIVPSIECSKRFQKLAKQTFPTAGDTKPGFSVSEEYSAINPLISSIICRSL
ncbi:hypothetical protein ALC56_06394 [Trachymyrmex septentrionalis]|uniref:Uncharacterized protein n=1 Tax=Trachymyrmex septentrionalis TaxID=34720 RepID=A0A151JXM9_9HYME|nr:hypothetical protein ALC56_06394 [Trachymyrmex septentrionalis]